MISTDSSLLSTRKPEIISSPLISPVSSSSAWHTVVLSECWENKQVNTCTNKRLPSSHSYRIVSIWTSFLGKLYEYVFPLHTGTLIVLKHPYPRKVEEPAIYESVRVHTAMQTGRTEDDLVPTAPSVSGHQSDTAFLPSNSNQVQ